MPKCTIQLFLSSLSSVPMKGYLAFIIYGLAGIVVASTPNDTSADQAEINYVDDDSLIFHDGYQFQDYDHEMYTYPQKDTFVFGSNDYDTYLDSADQYVDHDNPDYEEDYFDNEYDADGDNIASDHRAYLLDHSEKYTMKNNFPLGDSDYRDTVQDDADIVATKVGEISLDDDIYNYHKDETLKAFNRTAGARWKNIESPKHVFFEPIHHYENHKDRLDILKENHHLQQNPFKRLRSGVESIKIPQIKDYKIHSVKKLEPRLNFKPPEYKRPNLKEFDLPSSNYSYKIDKRIRSNWKTAYKTPLAERTGYSPVLIKQRRSERKRGSYQRKHEDYGGGQESNDPSSSLSNPPDEYFERQYRPTSNNAYRKYVQNIREVAVPKMISSYKTKFEEGQGDEFSQGQQSYPSRYRQHASFPLGVSGERKSYTPYKPRERVNSGGYRAENDYKYSDYPSEQDSRRQKYIFLASRNNENDRQTALIGVLGPKYPFTF